MSAELRGRPASPNSKSVPPFFATIWMRHVAGWPAVFVGITRSEAPTGKTASIPSIAQVDRRP